MMKTPTKFIALLSGAALLASSSFAADSVATTPVGYSTWEIPAGDGAGGRAFTTLALPLYSPTSSIDGSAAGVITGVTSSTITVSGAGWTDGDLSLAATPFCLRITKEGSSAEGRSLLISGNTADTLTIDLAASGVSDLTSLGIVADTDTFELIECDTLASLFGAPVVDGLVGGADKTLADNVWLIRNDAWFQFYYNTTEGHWTEVTFGTPDRSNQVILPDAGLLYSREANSTSSLVVTGTVPNVAREVTVKKSGVTVIGSAWPVDIELGDSGIEDIMEWQSSDAAATADIIYIMSDLGSWEQYFHDDVAGYWKKVTFGNPDSSTTLIRSGSAIILSKRAPATQDYEFTQALPYSL
jgi:hypothetical protein